MTMNTIDLQRRRPGERADQLLDQLQAAMAAGDRAGWDESGHARIRLGHERDDGRETIAARLDVLGDVGRSTSRSCKPLPGLPRLDAAVVLDRLPHEERAADLGDRGGDEERDRADGHGRADDPQRGGGKRGSSNSAALVDRRALARASRSPATRAPASARAISSSTSGSRRSRERARSARRERIRCRSPAARGSRPATARRAGRRRSRTSRRSTAPVVAPLAADPRRHRREEADLLVVADQ